MQYHETEWWRKWNGGVKLYLERFWAPFIDAELIDLAFMRAYYPSTVAAIHQFQGRRGNAPGNILPRHLTIPRRSRKLALFLENPTSVGGVAQIPRGYR